MKVAFNKVDKVIKKYQQGGEIPAQEAPVEGGTPVEEGAPAPEGGQDPMTQLVQGAMQALQTQDCNLSMQICQMLVQLAQGGAPEENTEPVYRKGGQLLRRVRK